MAGFQTPLHTTSPCRTGAAGARIANELAVGIDHPIGVKLRIDEVNDESA